MDNRDPQNALLPSGGDVRNFRLGVSSSLVPPFSRNARRWPKGGCQRNPAEIAVEKRQPDATNKTYRNGEIRDALFPLVTFGWDDLFILKVGSAPLNKPHSELTNFESTKTGYFKLRNAIANGLRWMAADLPRYWWLWVACVRQFRICETITWCPLATMARHIQLENLDRPWLLAGATKTRATNWTTSPEFCGVELLWRCANCFTSDANSFPSPTVGNPTTDAIRVVGLLKNKTVETTGYAKRDSALRTLTPLQENYTELTPMEKTDALEACGTSTLGKRIPG